MTKYRVPHKGDVYLINPNPQAGREMKDPHRFVVITPKEINRLGIVMAVPITSGGGFSRVNGLTVAVTGHDTSGVAICNQVRSFDIEERIKNKSAKFVETLDEFLINEIVLRVISIIDPAL